jgi:hypothetical protein
MVGADRRDDTLTRESDGAVLSERRLGIKPGVGKAGRRADRTPSDW